MANKKNIKPIPSSKTTATRPVEIYFAKCNELYQSSTANLVLWICIPLMLFGMFGLLWAMPFPKLNFLKTYNGFFNWASFLIALLIYVYYKLSPILSYFMLLVLMAFSFGVIKLVDWQNAGGLQLWIVSVVLLVLSFLGYALMPSAKNNQASIWEKTKILFITPLWMLHLALKKISINKY